MAALLGRQWGGHGRASAHPLAQLYFYFTTFKLKGGNGGGVKGGVVKTMADADHVPVHPLKYADPVKIEVDGRRALQCSYEIYVRKRGNGPMWPFGMWMVDSIYGDSLTDRGIQATTFQVHTRWGKYVVMISGLITTPQGVYEPAMSLRAR